MASDPHVHQRLVDLAKSLLKRTQNGSISWTATDNETVFLFSGTNTSVRISTSIDRDGDMHTILSLLNSRGTEVDSIEDGYRAAAISGWEPEDWNEVLDDLYYAARRNALMSIVCWTISSLILRMKTVQAVQPRTKDRHLV